MKIVELLISSGTARADQLMPGTGLCNLEETLTLTRHAHDLGCAAAMVLPPFFYVTASDEGLYRYFNQLVTSLPSESTKICLYHIPQNTGIGVSPALAARLNAAFPEVVTAYKDSSGNWDNTQAVISGAPGISVFPASETLLIKGMKIGAAGCISATCNSNVARARQIYDLMQAGDLAGAEALQAGAERHRLAAQKAGLIGGLKALKAHQSGDARWLNLRAPNENGDLSTGAALAASLG
jgi:4-hydroxy-tetrahydrodipicolinate synthase